MNLVEKLRNDGVDSLTADEKKTLLAGSDITEDERKSLLEEELDTKNLNEVISSNVAEQVERMAKAMADTFIAKAQAQRKRIHSDSAVKDPEKDEITRSWLKALFSDDKEKLKTFRQKDTTFNEEGDGAKGGYLVPTELLAEVLRMMQVGYGVARRNMRYLPFSGAGKSRNIPTLLSGVSAFWVNEAGAKGGTNPSFSLVTQTLKKLAAIIPFTEELLEDSAINLTQLVSELFAEAVAKEEDLAFFVGSGSPWTGILNNGSVNHVDMGAGDDITNVTVDDLIDVIDETPAAALPNAKWYLHRNLLNILRKLKDDNHNYIFAPASQGMPATILGYPYELCEALPNKTEGLTHQKAILMFGDLKKAAILGDKQQIRAKLLDQATITDGDGSTVINLAEQDMVALRLEERVGYLVVLPTAVTVLKTGTSS